MADAKDLKTAIERNIKALSLRLPSTRTATTVCESATVPRDIEDLVETGGR
jgi:hypothetical protein